MLPIGHRILVPLDGARESEGVLDAVVPLAKALGSEVTLLRVSQESDRMFMQYSYLQGIQESLRSKGIEAYGRMMTGDPGRKIAAFANLHGTDLIALSRTTRKGWWAFRKGVLDQVLTTSTVPVFVHRSGVTPRSLSKILVAVDGSREGELILPDASFLARRLNAAIRVVRANRGIVAPGLKGEALEAWFGGEKPGYLRRLCDHLAEDGVLAEPVSLYGSPGPTLIRHAEECGAGLVLLASRGRGPLESTFVGNLVRELMNGAPCPVLVRPILAGAHSGVG